MVYRRAEGLDNVFYVQRKMPVDTPLVSVPEAEQLDGSSSSEADDEDFNSEATESACSESTGSGADSDAADAEAGSVAEQAANALPAQTADAAASTDDYAGIWGAQDNAPQFVLCPPGARLTLGTRTLWEQTLRTSRTSTHQCWTLPTWRRRCALRLPHNLPLLLCSSTTAQKSRRMLLRTACGSPRRATMAKVKAKTTVAARATRRAQAPCLLALAVPSHWALPNLRF